VCSRKARIRLAPLYFWGRSPQTPPGGASPPGPPSWGCVGIVRSTLGLRWHRSGSMVPLCRIGTTSSRVGTGSDGLVLIGRAPGRGRLPAQPRHPVVLPTEPPDHVRGRMDRWHHAGGRTGRHLRPARAGNGAPSRPFVITSTPRVLTDELPDERDARRTPTSSTADSRGGARPAEATARCSVVAGSGAISSICGMSLARAPKVGCGRAAGSA
jgi:hypothetical protein